MTCTALIVAGGRGARFASALPKQYAMLDGRLVLRHTVLAFLGQPGIDAVQVVIAPDHRELHDAALGDLDLPPPVIGGATRQASVAAGLEALAAGDGPAPTHVLIHDAARPLASPALIARVLDALTRHEAVLPVLPVVDSLKRSADEIVTGEASREGLVRAQTPQGFAFDAILAAHRQAAARGETDHGDDAGLARAAGMTVATVPGEEANFKITLPEDLARAEDLLARRPRRWRTGSGFDVHAFAADRPLVLCGITVPHERGLAGHSDADVGLHALTDAIFGLIADGDIGSHFPPSDATWKDADSAQFLAHAVTCLERAGGRLEHVDVTLICERPKIGPHREAMRARLSGILGLDRGAVSVKATTTERLGFTGRGEGIAAQAVATASFAGERR